MTNWQTVPLGDAIELAYGKSLPKGSRDKEGPIPVYGSNGITGWHSEAVVNEPTVIVGRKGSAGAVQYVESPCYPIDTTYFVRVRSGFTFNIKFLFYLLLRLDLSRLRTATGVPGLSREDAYRERISFPPIAEQHRIVDLLSRAEGILQLRREARKKAADLIPAIFLEMFGDPKANQKQLPIRPVSDFVARFECGKNIQAGTENPDGYRILKVSAVTSGRYIEKESKASPDNYKPPTSHKVRQGDMLFSRANTVDLVGATAIVESTDGMTLLPDKLWRFVWSEDINIRYMHALFQLPGVRKMLGKLATGTSDSMRNISQSRLFALQLPIAAISQQNAFGRLSDYSRSIIHQQSIALGVAENAFQSILAKSFTT